jgi:hypothetical protein
MEQVVSDEWDAQGKITTFDGEEMTGSYLDMMGTYLRGRISDQIQSLWLLEDEGGEWHLVLTRDSPTSKARNPSLEEMLR